MSDKILVGAQLSCFINGVLYGQVTGFRFSSNTVHKETFALDSMKPFELQPTVCKVAGTVNLIRIVGDGGLEGAGVTTREISLPRLKYFTLALRDNFSDSVVFESRDTVVMDQSWDVRARGEVIGTFQFAGISWENEVQSGD